MSRIDYPFVKWAGGKSWAFPYLSQLLSGREFNNYFEPFMGGGASFSIIQAACNITQSIYLSDINPQLMNAHQVVQESPAALIKRLNSMKMSKEEYYLVRKSRPRKEITRAARFVYLNKLCFNGLYRENKSGEFNVPFGDRVFNMQDVAAKITKWSLLLSKATLNVCDFEESVSRAQRGDLVYFDPPYTVAHNNNGFIKYNQEIFSWNDQVRLSKAIKSLVDRDVAVILSNAHHSSVIDLFSATGLNLSQISRSSGIGSPETRRRVDELLGHSFRKS